MTTVAVECVSWKVAVQMKYRMSISQPTPDHVICKDFALNQRYRDFNLYTLTMHASVSVMSGTKLEARVPIGGRRWTMQRDARGELSVLCREIEEVYVGKSFCCCE